MVTQPLTPLVPRRACAVGLVSRLLYTILPWVSSRSGRDGALLSGALPGVAWGDAVLPALPSCRSTDVLPGERPAHGRGEHTMARPGRLQKVSELLEQGTLVSHNCSQFGGHEPWLRSYACPRRLRANLTKR